MLCYNNENTSWILLLYRVLGIILLRPTFPTGLKLLFEWVSGTGCSLQSYCLYLACSQRTAEGLEGNSTFQDKNQQADFHFSDCLRKLSVWGKKTRQAMQVKLLHSQCFWQMSFTPEPYAWPHPLGIHHVALAQHVQGLRKHCIKENKVSARFLSLGWLGRLSCSILLPVSWSLQRIRFLLCLNQALINKPGCSALLFSYSRRFFSRK